MTTTTIIALGVSALFLVLWERGSSKRIAQLESSVTFALEQLVRLSDPDVAQLRWEAHWDYHEYIEQMHQLVLRARSTGDLDRANWMMELQRWAERDYNAEWLEGMFRGFPRWEKP